MTTTTHERAADRDAILALNDRIRAAWNTHDAAAFADAFEEHADHINVFGGVMVGREAIHRSAAFIHAGPMAQSHSEVVVRDLRFLADDVAVLDLEQTMTGLIAQPGVPPPPWHRDGAMVSLIKMILRRTAGTWRVASFQNTAVMPTGPR